jgi:osmotically inducible protein OsmC
MATRKATADWTGTLKEGKGNIELGSGAFSGPFSFETRFEEGAGTNPEELLGAALAGCYAMALNATLEKEGTPAKRIHAVANVFLGKDDGGFKVNRIDLETEGEVEGFDQEKFAEVAERVKHTCIISRALAATDITLKASLVNAQAA